MYNFSQISAIFNLIIDYPVLAPYFKASMDFLHESAQLANEIKDPIFNFFSGTINSFNTVNTVLSFLLAFLLLFCTKFPSFLLTVLQFFISVFNCFLKVFEIKFQLLTFFFEKVTLFFALVGDFFISSLNFLIQTCPCYCYLYIKDKCCYKLRIKSIIPSKINNINFNSIVLNQNVENSESKVLYNNKIDNDTTRLNQNDSVESHQFEPNQSAAGEPDEDYDSCDEGYINDYSNYGKSKVFLLRIYSNASNQGARTFVCVRMQL